MTARAGIARAEPAVAVRASAGRRAIAAHVGRLLEAAAAPHCFLDDDAGDPACDDALEVLVDRRFLAAAERAVADLPAKRLQVPVSASLSGTSAFLALGAEQQLVPLRLCTALSLRPARAADVRLPWEDLLLSTRIRSVDGCWRVDPDLRAVLRAVRATADGAPPPPAPIDAGRIALYVRRLLGADAAAALPDLTTAARLGLAAFAPRWSWRRWIPRASGVGTAVPAAGGLVLAFVGCDGSGKSTVTRELRRWLGEHLMVRSVYLGSGQGSSSLLRWPLLLLHRLATRLRPARPSSQPADRPAASADPLAPPRHTGWGGRLRPVWALLLAREKRQKLHVAWSARRAGAVVVCDRYPQNEIMGFNDGPLLSHWRASGSPVRRALARREGQPYEHAQRHSPDLVIKLRVSPAVALRRKPDMTAAEVARRTAAVEALQFGIDTRTLVVDADAPLVQVLHAVKAGVWELL